MLVSTLFISALLFLCYPFILLPFPGIRVILFVPLNPLNPDVVLIALLTPCTRCTVLKDEMISQISLQSNRLTTRSSGESAVRLEIAIISIYGAKWPERSSWHVQGMASECTRFQSGLHDEIKSEPCCQDIVWNLYAESGVSLMLVRSLCCVALVFELMHGWLGLAWLWLSVSNISYYNILHSSTFIFIFVCIPIGPLHCFHFLRLAALLMSFKWMNFCLWLTARFAVTGCCPNFTVDHWSLWIPSGLRNCHLSSFIIIYIYLGMSENGVYPQV